MVEQRASGGADDEVTVVGGGIIGLACARALSGAGARVTVLDPGDPEARAGWAAGGMLAPLAEASAPGPFLEMARDSLRRYPGFVAELEASTGKSLGLDLTGKLLTTYDAVGEEALRDRIRELGEAGRAAEWLDGPEVRRLEPSLSPEVRGAILLRGQGRVDNRRLSLALEDDCRRRGVAFLQGRAESVLIRHGRIEGLRTTGGDRHGCEAVVLAAGAWSGGVAGLPRSLPVRPVKGEMLSFGAPEPALTRVATAGDRYLIPRETDQGPVIVVGATQEDAGFDRDVTATGQASLEAGARRLVPALRSAPVVERWAGLRPGTPDELPILGPEPEVPDLCYATGHFRNGVLLAPYTAERVREWWEGRG